MAQSASRRHRRRHRRPDRRRGPAPARLAGHRPGAAPHPWNRSAPASASPPTPCARWTSSASATTSATWPPGRATAGMRTPAAAGSPVPTAPPRPSASAARSSWCTAPPSIDAARRPAARTAPCAPAVAADARRPGRRRRPPGPWSPRRTASRGRPRRRRRRHPLRRTPASSSPSTPARRYAGFTTWRVVVPAPGRPFAPHETWGRGALWGTQPLKDGRIYAYAAAVAPAGGRAADDEKAELLRRFGDWHDPIPAILAAADPTRSCATTSTTSTEPLPAFHRGRVALLGDAAHAMAPTLGQGGNQAIEDAVVLAHHAAPDGDLAAAPRRLHRATGCRAPPPSSARPRRSPG